MARYRGYFNSLSCKNYEVRITPSGDTSAYQEIMLAGDEPFVVRYKTSETPFDPVRTSTATINIVRDDYLEDALSNCAQGTKVELLDITTPNSPVTLWIGFLTPKVFDAGYSNCYESFSLEAADCISSLQYVDYEEINGGGITSILDILAQICDACEELEGFYWTRGKKLTGGIVLYPSTLKISEHNFQTNDTDEYWKLNDVLKEISQYLGFTCLQYGKRMYFIDYQYLENNGDIYCNFFSKANNYGRGSATHLDSAYTVTASSYMSNDSSISMEPIYNKMVVNANMYAADEFIPNPFDDKYLTNRRSTKDFYANFEVMPIEPYKPSYPHGGTWYSLGFEQGYKEEDSADTQYRYFQRLYDNKYWDSVYTDDVGNVMMLPDDTKAGSGITKDYRGGTIVDLGVVRKVYKSETQQSIVASKMDYNRYLCICQKHNNLNTGHSRVVYKLKRNFKSRVMLDDKSFLVLNCSAIFERYEGRNYINPSWVNTECKTRWTAAGKYRNMVARPFFKIHIGNKGWSSTWNEWVPAGSAWDYCTPEMKWDDDNITFWNQEIEILNNVSWEDKVNCEGIKIPLSGIDTSQVIEFEVINPNPSFYGNTGNPDFMKKFYQYNAYCWISDFSLKCVQEGQDEDGNDGDVTYENVIDECSVNEINELTVKITTHTDKVKPSYSHMIWTSASTNYFLTGIIEGSLGNTSPQKPEENIIQKYVHQYSTPTKKITLTLTDTIKPFQRLLGVDVDNPSHAYVQLGTEIDYRMGRQTITAVQKTK